MKLMADENISPYLARALRELFAVDHEIKHIRERFGPSTTDLSWIKTLNSEGNWIILSADRRITRNRTELHAFKSSSLIGFFLCRTIAQKPVHKQMIRILQIWESLEVQASLVRPGAAFEITERGEKFRSL